MKTVLLEVLHNNRTKLHILTFYFDHIGHKYTVNILLNKFKQLFKMFRKGMCTIYNICTQLLKLHFKKGEHIFVKLESF